MFGTGLPILTLLVTTMGCARPPIAPAPPPNVILISVDTLRADRLGAYGYTRDTSPFLDSLCERGVRFERAFAPASWTLPSHMSLMTSSYPHTHRVENIERSLPESIPTLARELQKAGYSTTGFVSWVYLSATFGFGQGFDTYHELLPPPDRRGTAGHDVIRAGPFVDKVLEWANAAPRDPYFLFLHLFDPHMSYEPPLEHARRFDPTLDGVEHGDYERLKPYIRGMHDEPERVPAATLARASALYDGEIHYTDSELRRLFGELERLGLLDNTIVVFVSDHGEEFDEHGSMEGHGWTLYDEVLHVPLVVLFPDGRGAGRSVGPMIEILDVAPTILDAAGLAPPSEFQGSSLLPLVEDPASAARDDRAFAQTQRFNVKWSMRTSRYKLIYTLDTMENRFGVPVRPGFEMYDLEHDPGELRDVYDEEWPVAQELARELEAFAKSKRELPTSRPGLSEEQLERLRALGYLGGNP